MSAPFHPPVVPAETDRLGGEVAVETATAIPPPLGEPISGAAAAGPAPVVPVFVSRETAPVWNDPPGARTQWSSPVSAPAAVRWREVLCVLLLVVLSDLTVYRGEGFAGCAALFLVAPGLLLAGSPRPKAGRSYGIVVAMLLALSARLVWQGSALGVAAGFVLLVASAMAVAGRRIYVPDIVPYAIQTIAAGCVGMIHYVESRHQLSPKALRGHWLSVILPLAAISLFGTMFVLANPDLATSFGESIREALRWLTDWSERFSLGWAEVLFWLAVAWVSIGLLRPIMRRPLLAGFSTEGQSTAESSTALTESPLYPALRNTLVALIALFVVYLAFEFKTLWFRRFPKGFYYAGYAHEGAAWLTASLALATIVLSLIFRGRILRDPRLPRLRRLAWIWSAENLVLAATVYNRLWIYVSFNGMTWMRTVAIFGVSAVVAGVVLVVWKIVAGRDFVWLLRRQMAALALVIYLFALTPVDALVHTYNVRRALTGDLAPSVQISVHPIDAEGILVLPPLLQSDDEIIREGIRAMLAERAIELERRAGQPDQQHWTALQLADRRLFRQLSDLRLDWARYANAADRAAALDRFHEYAYQWY